MDSIGMVPIVSMSMIQESIIRARISANAERKLEAARRIDYYEGTQKQRLEDILNKQFQHPERLKLQMQFYNIVRQIIDEISILYKLPARRILKIRGEDAPPEIQEKYSLMLKQSNIDSVLKLVNRYANLLNTVGVKPTMRNERLELDILTPDILNIVQDPMDPTKSVAVIIEQTFSDSVTVDSEENPWAKEKLYIVWTDSQHEVFNASGARMPELANKDGINPYGILPVVFFRDKWPSGEFWGEGTQDLIITQDSINVKLTELNNLVKMQAFSVPVVIGDLQGAAITIDPSNYLQIPLNDIAKGTPDFKFVSPSPKIQELIEIIDREITRIATGYGISPDSFKLTGSPTSGFALKMQNLKLLNRRQDEMELYSAWEEQLFKVMRAVWNAHQPASLQIPEDAEFSINFSEIDFPEDPDAEDRRWQLRVKNNLSSLADWMMSIDPDIKSKEDAVKRIEENKQINDKFKFLFGGMGDGNLAKDLGVEEEEEEGDE